jgi:large subunit ribosomal protein L9
LAAAQALAEKMTGIVVEVARKAGVDGRLFGSVTNADIAEGLKAKGFDVEKGAVRMPNGPLKTVSETTLDVSLHTDVLAQITVQVKGEQ